MGNSRRPFRPSTKTYTHTQPNQTNTMMMALSKMLSLFLIAGLIGRASAQVAIAGGMLASSSQTTFMEDDDSLSTFTQGTNEVFAATDPGNFASSSGAFTNIAAGTNLNFQGPEIESTSNSQFNTQASSVNDDTTYEVMTNGFFFAGTNADDSFTSNSVSATSGGNAFPSFARATTFDTVDTYQMMGSLAGSAITNGQVVAASGGADPTGMGGAFFDANVGTQTFGGTGADFDVDDVVIANAFQTALGQACIDFGQGCFMGRRLLK